jgi:ADP-ribose pyrophosphatase
VAERETLLTTRKYRIDRVQVPARGGGTVGREVLVHPGAAVILPILDDGRVVLIHNHRHAVGRPLLELPAGTLDPGEDPAVCAARELTEETGYRAAKLTPLVGFFSSPGLSDERMHVFVATGLTAGEAALEEAEQITPALMAPGEIDALAKSGALEDGKTLAAWLYWRAFGGQGAQAGE